MVQLITHVYRIEREQGRKILEGGDDCREDFEEVRNEPLCLLGLVAVKFGGGEGGLGQWV